MFSTLIACLEGKNKPSYCIQNDTEVFSTPTEFQDPNKASSHKLRNGEDNICNNLMFLLSEESLGIDESVFHTPMMTTRL